MPDTTKLLELVDVTKTFGSPEDGEMTKVLDGVTLSVAAGESLAVVGPSGSGKSTLLNLCGALDRPSSGRIVFDGRDLSELNDRVLSAIRNWEIGFVFQLHHLLPQCTVFENVLIPTLAGGGSSAETEERARSLLARVGLESRMTYKPGQLSGGERQRVALVRALINQPKLLLADEPTGSLDHASAGGIAELLIELNREEGVTLIVVTHSLELARKTGLVLTLHDGVLCPEGC